MKVHFVEKNKTTYQTDDNRFTMIKSQGQSGHKFTIHDNRKDQKVGAPKSFTGAVALTRRYLLQEKQAEGIPSTMPKSRIGDGIAPIRVVKAESVPGKPVLVSNSIPVDQEGDPKYPQNSQIVMAHLASIASEDGMFSSYRTTISKTLGLKWTHVDYWLNKFIAMGWVVEIEPETEGQPGKYGFDMTSEEVRTLIKNMPGRIVTKTVTKTVESKLDNPSPAGIMAGKAMVRIGELETKIEGFMKEIMEMKSEIDKFRQELQNKEKPDLGEYESIFNYLEESQNKVNVFIHETFGVKIL